MCDETKEEMLNKNSADKKRKKRRIAPLVWLLLAALVVVFIFSTYHFISEFMAYKRAREEYKGLASYITIAPGAGEDAEEEDGGASGSSSAPGSGSGTEAAGSNAGEGSGSAGAVSGGAADDPAQGHDIDRVYDDRGVLLKKSGVPGIFRAGTLFGKYELIASESLADPYAEDGDGTSAGGSAADKKTGTASGGSGAGSTSGDSAGKSGTSGTGASGTGTSGTEDLQTAESGPTALSSAAAKTADAQKDGEDSDVLNGGSKVYISYPRLDIDHKHLKEVNEDYVGVLFVPCLDIVYPVAQSHDNKEYLRKTFEGNYNAAGCIFMDAYANRNMSDTNTFILGHNMRDLSMFGSLKTLETNPELCPEHPYFYLYTPGKVYKYAIFAYCTVPSKDELYSFYDAKYDPQAYDEFIKKSTARSLYTPEEGVINFSERPTLCTLSTCYGTGHINNFIVQGALLGAARTSTITNAAAEP